MANRGDLQTSSTDANIQSAQRPPFLRRCSISDPRLENLNLPHFSPDKSFNPFNRVLSGLFEGSGFSLNKLTGSTDSVDKDGHLHPTNDHTNLLQDPHHHITGTPRSVVDLKGTTVQQPPANTTVPATGLRKSATSISALFGSSPHQQQFPTIPETEDQQGGLFMSARPHAAGALTSHADAQSNNGPKEAARNPQKTGGFMKMLGSGFLTRPVLHSPEENYRYIMTMDR